MTEALVVDAPLEATLTLFAYDERPTLNCVRSLIRDARRWPQLAIWDTAKDALISRARSAMAEMFLEQGAGDVLLMVDHDIGWEPGDLENLTRACIERRGVVGGVFSKRGFSDGVPIRFGTYGQWIVPDNRLVESVYVATGFIAVHRAVLEAMAPTLPRTIHGWRAFFATEVKAHDGGKVEYLSEDYAFCGRARELGFGVWADLRAQLTHHGTHLYRVADTMWKPPAPGATARIQQADPEAPLQAKRPGGGTVELYIDPDDRFVCAALLRGELWEPEVPAALAEAIRPDDIVVEIGSHIGYDTVLLAPLVADEGRYIAVEPMPHLAALLRRNINHNGLKGAVEVWEAAVINDEDTRRRVRMMRDMHNPGASHLLLAEDPQGLEVAAARLPDITSRADVLKIDAEGAEYAILSGPRSRAVLASTRVLVTEYCEDQLRAVSGVTGAQYIALLDELGFDTSDIDMAVLPKGKGYCNLMLARRRDDDSSA